MCKPQIFILLYASTGKEQFQEDENRHGFICECREYQRYWVYRIGK